MKGAKAKFTIDGHDYEIDVVASKNETTKMKAEDVAAAVKAKIGDTVTVTSTGNKGGTANVTVTGDTITFTSTTKSADQDWKTTKLNVSAAKVDDGKVPDTTNSTATVKTLDFDGRIGEDMIGGTIKIGDTTYEFVETGKDPKTKGATAIEVDKDATGDTIAAAVRGKLNNITTDDGGAWTVAGTTTKVTLTAAT